MLRRTHRARLPETAGRRRMRTLVIHDGQGEHACFAAREFRAPARLGGRAEDDREADGHAKRQSAGERSVRVKDA